ncbi:MAG TPA: deoxyribodipyrimidine photo-lyase, partial [Vampirovibrionales bacterium]
MVTSIILFRNNLRIHDNEALIKALSDSNEVLPIFCFEPHLFKKTPLINAPKLGPKRLKFLKQSVKDLKQNLKDIGLNLLISQQPAVQLIPSLIHNFPQIQTVYSQKEIAHEEVYLEQQLDNAITPAIGELKLYETNSLYKLEELPFKLPSLPDIFTSFRHKVEKQAKVRTVFSASNLPSCKLSSIFEYLKSEDDFLEIENVSQSSDKACMRFKGGETESLKRLHYYLWGSKKILNYKQTRNQLLGPDYSTKFSPWLANGCLSPVQIYNEVRSFEKEYGANESTYWVIFELLWREYFRLSARKHGNKIFWKNGLNASTNNDEISKPTGEA